MTSKHVTLRSETGALQSIENISKDFSGITTRKRAALKTITTEILNDKNKKVTKISESAVESCEVKKVKEKVDAIVLSLEDEFKCICDNPIKWPGSDSIDEVGWKEFYRKLTRRKEIICKYYQKQSKSDIPIWAVNAEFYDEFMNAKYVNHIMDFIYETECDYKPLGLDFLGSDHKFIRGRYALVNTFVEIQENYNISAETLHLTVAIADRFLKKRRDSLKTKDLTIIGPVCMFIASKLEELYMPSLEEMLKNLDLHEIYSEQTCVELERSICEVVDFRFNFPSSLHFIRMYCVLVDAEKALYNCARYFCDLCLQDYYSSAYSVNIVGAACVFMALVIDKAVTECFESVWTVRLQCASGLLYSDIERLVKNLCLIINKQSAKSRYRAIFKKYNSRPGYDQVPLVVIKSVGFHKILEHFCNLEKQSEMRNKQETQQQQQQSEQQPQQPQQTTL